MKLTVKDQSETEFWAAKLAGICKTGDVIALSGDLGVGKSLFARAFIRHLCGAETDVPSPTFNLVQIYDFEGGEINHYDFYRLNHPDECLELGVEEAFFDALCLVEWPDKIGSYLPWDCLHVRIDPFNQNETQRRLHFQSEGDWMNRLKEWDTDHAR